MSNYYIPFIQPPKPNLALFNKLFMRSIKSNQYSNFGANEQDLTEKLSKIHNNYPVVCCANATIALQFFEMLPEVTCSSKPAFTFPATYLNTIKPSIWADCDNLGYAIHKLLAFKDKIDLCITTIPFGDINYVYKIKRPKLCKLFIIDAAASNPIDEKLANELLFEVGADAFVVSMHATKLLSAGEGAFVVFKNKDLANRFKDYINFGKEANNLIGTNGKLSEANAALALSYLKSGIAKRDMLLRRKLVYKLLSLFGSSGKWISSYQANWLYANSAENFIKFMQHKGIECRRYYYPIAANSTHAPMADRLSKHGVCIPSWGMDNKRQLYLVNALKEYYGILD